MTRNTAHRVVLEVLIPAMQGSMVWWCGWAQGACELLQQKP